MPLTPANKRKLVLTIVLCGMTLAWGFAMGRYEAFPFRTIQTLKLRLFPFDVSALTPNYETAGWREAVRRFEASPAEPTVVMLGDSLTRWNEWHEWFPEVAIINRGIDGETSRGLLLRLDEVLNRHPAAIFLLIGFNDYLRGEPVNAVAERIAGLIKSAKAAGTDVIVQSVILPGRNEADDRRAWVSELNTELRSLCAELGTPYVDLNAAIAPDGFLPDAFTSDGIHLTSAGYQAWEAEITPRIHAITAESAKTGPESP